MAEKEDTLVEETPLKEDTPAEKTFTQEEVDRALAEAKADAEKAYQGLQKVVSKKDEAIRAEQARAQEIEERLYRIDTELAFRKGTTVIEDPDTGEKKTSVPNVEEILRQSDERRRTERALAETSKRIGEVKDLIVEAGFSVDDPEFQEAEYFATHPTGKYLELAKQKATEVIEKKKVATPVTPLIDEEELRKKITAEIAQQYGLTIPESGITQAGQIIYTEEQIRDLNFYLANKEDILKAQKEGRIKLS